MEDFHCPLIWLPLRDNNKLATATTKIKLKKKFKKENGKCISLTILMI